MGKHIYRPVAYDISVSRRMNFAFGKSATPSAGVVKRVVALFLDATSPKPVPTMYVLLSFLITHTK